MRRLAHLLALIAALVAGQAVANQCAAPGAAGTVTLGSGVVNTYFPAAASVNAGATSISLGQATGAATPIAAGDLLLVIQMQDVDFNVANSDAYGDGVTGGGASGYTAIRQAGRYEFVRAAGSVGIGGGTLTLVGANGAGLINAYTHNAANSATAKRAFQVVRVPQYANVTLTGVLIAAAWNGTSGGVVAIDVADRLTFSGGSISAAGLGFRGGAGRQLAGGAGVNTDYRTLATVPTNGAKGEGVAGTPRYVNNNGVLLDTTVEGYPNGSQGRGAPGNAGGGGTDGNPAQNDQNTGGGGGGNGGPGGLGGYAWCNTAPSGCAQTGGQPGAALTETAVDRLVMGGGGGAGVTNNATGTPALGFASSGAAGGGVVIVRAGEISGSGSINANGASGNTSVLNDGSGGGGAGGSVLLAVVRNIGGSVAVSANGGNGGSNTGNGAAHGPGGGGGGGFVATTFAVASSVAGGASGVTQNGGATFGNAYGARGGNGGRGVSIVSADIAGVSSGGECTPTVTKAFAASETTPGVSNRLTVTVVNNNPDLPLTSFSFLDTYPMGIVNWSTPAPGSSCATAATIAAAAGGGSLSVSAATVPVAATCAYSVNTVATSPGAKVNTIPAGAITGAYGPVAITAQDPATATVTVSSPLSVTKVSRPVTDPVNGAANAKFIPGARVGYTIAVTNSASYTVTGNSIVVVDRTPDNLSLLVDDGGAAGSGPIIFGAGTPASGLTYSFTNLASQTDDVDFSRDGSNWTYVPVPNTAGVDPLVTHFRVRPKGSMAAGSNFSLGVRYVLN
ncbi:MAG TPA: hypothetical protein VF636_06015 [Sphingomonas sp.]